MTKKSTNKKSKRYLDNAALAQVSAGLMGRQQFDDRIDRQAPRIFRAIKLWTYRA